MRAGGDQQGNGHLSVRRAGPQDWAALRQARLTALADSPAAFGSTLEHERGLSDDEWRRRAQTTVWFLAWRDGEPAGLVAGFPVHGEPGEWHLVSMWASPEVRGRGVARRLVTALAAEVRQAGAERLTLWVADGNGRALAFYLRCGFRPSGRRQTYQRPDGSAFGEQELMLRW